MSGWGKRFSMLVSQRHPYSSPCGWGVGSSLRGTVTMTAAYSRARPDMRFRAASLLYLSIKCSRLTADIALTGTLIAFWQLNRYVFMDGSSISCFTAVWCCS
uniref:Uncharacterized protein n=1 Tax=Anopheles quadriannulatus TaxID=34691 RepID=A0A182XFR3_ANOQN